MNEVIQNIMEKINKKGIQRNCKKILKKCSLKSVKDTGFITEIAIWLYIYGYYDEAISVCEILESCEFNGNYTLWNNIDHACCIKARILREKGRFEESKEIIEYVNKFRNQELYGNLISWFNETIEMNIKSNVENNLKADARQWRLLKLECAIAYKEVGGFPIADSELEMVIEDLRNILAEEK